MVLSETPCNTDKFNTCNTFSQNICALLLSENLFNFYFLFTLTWSKGHYIVDPFTSPLQITIFLWNWKLIKVAFISKPKSKLLLKELVFVQNLYHRLAEHRGHRGDTEGEEGGEDGFEAGDDEAVEALEAVHGAEDHVQPADQDGGDTARDKLRVEKNICLL